jgi:hypothetical protein
MVVHSEIRVADIGLEKVGTGLIADADHREAGTDLTVVGHFPERLAMNQEDIGPAPWHRWAESLDPAFLLRSSVRPLKGYPLSTLRRRLAHRRLFARLPYSRPDVRRYP